VDVVRQRDDPARSRLRAVDREDVPGQRHEHARRDARGVDVAAVSEPGEFLSAVRLASGVRRARAQGGQVLRASR
jgi:hypothetical protein